MLGRLIPAVAHFYGSALLAQTVSALLFAGLCVYVWRGATDAPRRE
jgi:hypothetical protein